MSGADSGIDGPRWVELSSDDRSLYVTSDNDAAITRFERSPNSGKLTWAGCVTAEIQSGPAGSDACKLIPTATNFGANSGLSLPRSLAATDEQLFAIGSNDTSIATFRIRNSGALEFKRCLSANSAAGPTGTGACRNIPAATEFGADTGMSEIRDIEVTADGRSLYAAAQDDSAMTTFRRDPETGRITFAGCLSGDTDIGPGGTGACDLIPGATAGGSDSGLSQVETVATSRDGRSVYGGVEGDDAVARFKRERP